MTTQLAPIADAIDLDAILATPELTQAEIDMFDINFLLESTNTDTVVDDELLNFEF